MISYDPLFHLLLNKHMVKSDLTKELGFSPRTIAKFSKGKSVSMLTIEALCLHFHCNVEDIVKVLPNDNK